MVGLWHAAPGVKIDQLNMAPSFYFIYREQNRSFQDVGLWDTDSDTVTGRGVPERAPSLYVTDGVLPMLGAHPELGRLFSAKDCQTGNPDTVILMYSFWQSHFGGSPSAIGQDLIVNAKPRRIVGVMPQGFRFLDAKPEIIFPYQFDRANVHLGQFSFNGMARLKPGVTIAQANADVGRMIPIAFASFPPRRAIPPPPSPRPASSLRYAPSCATSPAISGPPFG